MRFHCQWIVWENEALFCPGALWEIHMLFGFISISVQPLKMVIWFKTMRESFCVKVNVAGISLFALCRAFGSLSHDLLFALFIIFIELRSINNHRQHHKAQNSLPKRVSHVKDIWGHIIKIASHKTNATYNNKVCIEESETFFFISTY